MEYRILGNTGLRVSALSLGASPLGCVFNQVPEPAAVDAVHAALDLGINFIDVSPFYGLTKAETVLGKALRGVRRERYLLATKVGRYGHEPADFDFSAERVTRSVDESLERLGVEHVELIQCHDIEFGTLDQIVEETLPALRAVVAAGKARYIGITGLPLEIFPQVLERTRVDTILSYCHYTLGDDSLTTLLPFLRKEGVGIINASPLGMGLLTEKGPPAWHPASRAIKAACAEAALFCKARHSNLAKLAVQWAVANDTIPTTLIGTASRDNIEHNVRWLDEPIDAQLLAGVRQILAPIHNQTWPSGTAANDHPVKVTEATHAGASGL